MKNLYLEDLAGHTQAEVQKHISDSYEVPLKEVKKYKILIAYESVGSWGCDSSSWFLLEEKETGKLFENHAGHCSCYGFEGQFEPEETTVQYLQSDKFYMSFGGYDGNRNENEEKIEAYIKEME